MGKFHQSREWRELSEAWRAEHPLCVACEAEGKVTEATEVDHVIPIHRRPDLRFDRSNLQSLCSEHHRRKSLADNRRQSGATFDGDLTEPWLHLPRSRSRVGRPR